MPKRCKIALYFSSAKRWKIRKEWIKAVCGVCNRKKLTNFFIKKTASDVPNRR